MAIQINGVEVNGAFTLIATRVIDTTSLGTEEEDAGESVNGNYWETKASKSSLQITDQLFELIRGTEPAVTPNYTKNYIGLSFGGKVRSFITFRPRQNFVGARFRFPRDGELDDRLDQSGLSVSSYRRGYYRVSIAQSDDISAHQTLLKELIKRAFDVN